MDKIKVYQGGHPLKLDNIDYIQEGIAQAFDGFLKGVSPGSLGIGCRLDGVEPTFSNGGNTVDVASGYVVMYNGAKFEILKVAAHQVTKGNSQYFVWELTVTNDIIDPQIYANTQSKYVHEKRRAVVVAVDSEFLRVPLEAPYLCDLITGGEWIELSHSASNYLTDDEPTVDWDISGASISALYGKDNKTRHVNVLITSSQVSGGNAQVLKVKLPEAAKSNGVGTAFIFGHDFCVCSINAGSDELGIVSVSGGIFQNITGALISVRAAITFEVN